MHDESSRAGLDATSRSERAVLALLLAEGPRPWTVSELALELGDQLETVDALAALHGLGLVHRRGEFSIASRAAVHAARLLQ
jgi:hypothetical protein